MILRNIATSGGDKIVSFVCKEPKPGQCVVVSDRYFVIAHHFNEIGSVVTSPGSAIDLAPGTHIEIKAIGKGFDISYDSTPVIITGGIGYAAGLSLADHFIRNRTDFKMISYTRGGGRLNDVTSLLGIRHNQMISEWDTSKGRPESPFKPVEDVLNEDTPIYFAGTRELLESCRNTLNKLGYPQNNIRLNF